MDLLCFPQVVLLSATMPAEVLEVTKKFMRDPVRILVKKEELTLEGIKQFYINVEREVCVFSKDGRKMEPFSPKAPCWNCRSQTSLVWLMWPCKHGYTREGEQRPGVESEAAADLFLNVQCLLPQDPVSHDYDPRC